MNGGGAIRLNAALARTKQRANQSGLALKPTNPNRWVTAVSGTVAEDKLIISVTNAITKIPTKIFLTGFGIGRDATSAKLLHQGAR